MSLKKYIYSVAWSLYTALLGRIYGSFGQNLGLFWARTRHAISISHNGQFTAGSLERVCTSFAVVGSLIFIGDFPQESPIINGSFAPNDLQLKAS